jgi:shikimate dehydrogenase
MYFIGVTTGQSSIMTLFPRWAEILGLADAQLVGVDCPIHAEPAAYRAAVRQIKDDPLSLGALVTTHKIDLLEAARNLFDELDPYARLCNEVSNIAKREDRLIGLAKDPITSGRALAEMIDAGYWGRTGAHVLSLGAGGATTALAAGLLSQPDPADRPERFIGVGRSRRGLDALRRIVAELGTDADVVYVLNEDPAANDRLIAALPPGSLVVNATGMGKDRPGSPITDDAVFPRDGIVWELNYRGALDFLRQARRQESSRGLAVHDGWRYFIHSWVEHIAEVFGLEVSPATFGRLAAAADAIRPAG